jgi:hypothetical protein
MLRGRPPERLAAMEQELEMNNDESSIERLRAELTALTLSGTYESQAACGEQLTSDDTRELMALAVACVKLAGRINLRLNAGDTYTDAREAADRWGLFLNPAPQAQSLKPLTEAMAAIDVAQHPPKQLLLLRGTCRLVEDWAYQVLVEDIEDEHEAA